MNLNELINKKIAILWFGREGKSTLSFLQKIWCKDITILDKYPVDCKCEKVRSITWDNYLDNLDQYDYIIKSPWISPYVNWLIKYRDKLITQTEIFFRNYSWKVIWVTWTKGKSTTATLIYEVLKDIWYDVKLVWNIWKPVLDEIDIFSTKTYDFVVFEMSSYMLDSFSPNLFAWILINLYKEHLDWHDGFENYKDAKLNILKNAKYKFINNDLKDLVTGTGIYFFWKNWNYIYKNWSFFIDWIEVLKNTDSKLVWEHFLINTASILWLIDLFWKIDWKNYIKNLQNVLRNFSPLPHRLQNIWTFNWITFIDDAISTTPESTIEAIKTYINDVETIFLWWTDRWYDFENLVEIIKNTWIKNIVLFPDTWNKIKLLLNNSFNILETKSMKDAVEFAYKYTSNWKVCLLSTASPSYSNWKNYEEKWDEFKKYIEESK